MTLYVANISAMRFWRWASCPVSSLAARTSIRRLADSAASLRGIVDCGSLAARFGPGPLHVLVDRSGKCHGAHGVITHLRTGELPSGSILRLTDGLCIASPELSFLEMAAKLTFPEVVEYGFQLCGTYTSDPDAAALNGRPPLTTCVRLASYIERSPGRSGCARAAEALGYVLEEAASPLEARLALLLCLPTAKGGCGLPAPVMNHRIPYTRRERELYGRSCAVLDLYWPDHRVGVEYDGARYHSQAESLARDRRKGSELACKGITVVRVDKQQVATPFMVHVLARKLASLLGCRLRRPTDRQWRNREGLHRVLFSFNGSGSCLLNDAPDDVLANGKGAMMAEKGVD